jgi:arylsulfatase A-like enzyme
LFSRHAEGVRSLAVIPERHPVNLRIVVATLITMVVASPIRAGDTVKPNIVVIIADDLGWRDVGFHGSEIKTPHLDQLARAGVRLERHYVYPTCSPTRAGIFTGRNPSRFKIHAPIAGKSEQALPAGTLTIARLLQMRGYVTAMIGKWHLGLRPDVGPRRFGYDASYGYFHGQLDPYTHLYKNGDKSWHRNDQFIEEKGHVTDLLTDEAVRFIETLPPLERGGQGGVRKPFFLWLAHATPHYPLVEEEKWVTPYNDTIKDPSRRLYAASITHMDDAIGRVVKALERAKLIDNTLIVFTSDNGGFEKYQSKTDYNGKYQHPKLGDNQPLRGWKGELYDGGVRVPALAYWRGKLQPAAAPEIVSMLDWYPTFAKLAGAEVPASAKIEGRDVWPILARAKTKPANPVLYWNVGNKQAVLVDGWKLIVNAKNQKMELFDMQNEMLDQTGAQRDRLVQLQAVLKKQRDLDPQ